jgi:hypothetical protein
MTKIYEGQLTGFTPNYKGTEVIRDVLLDINDLCRCTYLVEKDMWVTGKSPPPETDEQDKRFIGDGDNEFVSDFDPLRKLANFPTDFPRVHTCFSDSEVFSY